MGLKGGMPCCKCKEPLPDYVTPQRRYCGNCIELMKRFKQHQEAKRRSIKNTFKKYREGVLEDTKEIHNLLVKEIEETLILLKKE